MERLQKRREKKRKEEEGYSWKFRRVRRGIRRRIGLIRLLE
jgi:hypothetical protein